MGCISSRENHFAGRDQDCCGQVELPRLWIEDEGVSGGGGGEHVKVLYDPWGGGGRGLLEERAMVHHQEEAGNMVSVVDLTNKKYEVGGNILILGNWWKSEITFCKHI